LMRYFPGSQGQLPYDEQAMKYLLYNCMLTDWKLEFAKNGRSINEPTLDFEGLVTHFSIQEVAYNSKGKRKINNRNETSDRNRRRGGFRPFQGGRGSFQNRNFRPFQGGNGNNNFGSGRRFNNGGRFGSPNSYYQGRGRPFTPQGRGQGSPQNGNGNGNSNNFRYRNGQNNRGNGPSRSPNPQSAYYQGHDNQDAHYLDQIGQFNNYQNDNYYEHDNHNDYQEY